MKVMFAADLHGSVRFTEELLRAFSECGCDYLWLLGDILYGAGWSPPQEYDSRETARMLNRHAGRIIAVRGNCDCDADLNVLAFPAVAPYCYVVEKGRRFFLTHGHLYCADNIKPGWLNKGDVFLYGHTHRVQAEQIDGIYVLNPGSISLPSGGAPHTYGIIEDGLVRIMATDGYEVSRISISQ